VCPPPPLLHVNQEQRSGCESDLAIEGVVLPSITNSAHKKTRSKRAFLLRVSSASSDCLQRQQILNVIRSVGSQTALQPVSTDVFSFARLNEQDYIALIPQLLKQSCLVAGNGHENISCD
jgi:hypothetical protein